MNEAKLIKVYLKGDMDVPMQGAREQLGNSQHTTEMKLFLKTSWKGVSRCCASSIKQRHLF